MDGHHSNRQECMISGGTQTLETQAFKAVIIIWTRSRTRNSVRPSRHMVVSACGVAFVGAHRGTAGNSEFSDRGTYNWATHDAGTKRATQIWEQCVQ
jgi:hypothetical protein